MKYVILMLFFVAIPFLLLQNLVMPMLESLENTYRNVDVIAEKAVLK